MYGDIAVFLSEKQNVQYLMLHSGEDLRYMDADMIWPSRVSVARLDLGCVSPWFLWYISVTISLLCSLCAAFTALFSLHQCFCHHSVQRLPSKTTLITCRVVAAAAAISAFRWLQQLVVKSIIITRWKPFCTNDFTQQSYIRSQGNKHQLLCL